MIAGEGMPSGVEHRLQYREELIWLLPLIGFAAMVFVVAQTAGAHQGLSAVEILGGYGRKIAIIFPVLLEFTLIAFLIRAIVTRSRSPLRELALELRARFGTPMLASAAVGPLLLMPIVIAAYGVLKQLMPLYTPFVLDDGFAAADRLLFLGHQPWEFTHAVFGSYTATLIIDRIYTLWVGLLFLAILGFALFAPRYDRARFFLSFASAWVLLGVVGAYLGASAGPCYTALTGANSAPEFAGLIERLGHYSADHGTLGAVKWQAVLWEAHIDRSYGFAMGISAMPSLHNAIAVLYALAFARAGRGWAIAGWSFAIIIFVGSIHLGWHYAVDGIVSALAMVGIWWAAGRYLEWTGYRAATAAGPRVPALAVDRPALA